MRVRSDLYRAKIPKYKKKYFKEIYVITMDEAFSFYEDRDDHENHVLVSTVLCY